MKQSHLQKQNYQLKLFSVLSNPFIRDLFSKAEESSQARAVSLVDTDLL